jgi:hypothetical protein
MSRSKSYPQNSSVFVPSTRDCLVDGSGVAAAQCAVECLRGLTLSFYSDFVVGVEADVDGVPEHCRDDRGVGVR